MPSSNLRSVFNLARARALRVTIAADLLVRANEVIEQRDLAALAQGRSWHKAEEFDGATIATAIQGYNRHAKRVPGMPALDPKAQVNGPCRWASLFQLFPYESIDAHLSVARKWGRLCRIDEPISFFLDVPDHRCSSP